MLIDTVKTTILEGQRAPLCVGMTSANVFYSFEAQAGRAAVILLAGSLNPVLLAPVIAAFESRHATFASLDADIVVIVNGQGSHALDWAACSTGKVQTIYCLSDYFEKCAFDDARPFVFTMDRNQRVIKTIDTFDSHVVEKALSCIAALPNEQARDIALPAPVLLIPNIISEDFSRRLIDHFETSHHTAGGMASIDKDGKPIHKIDPTKKMREDCVITPAMAVHGEILNAITRICFPEMKKAYQFDAGYMDRILIARYDETGGYFKRHRDNVAASVAFRQFAISINLNTDEYDGGYLTFPEFNDHRYRPGRGAGIIFSASLLHEVTPVTKGSRYVLLTFFHNAEAQQRREAARQA